VDGFSKKVIPMTLLTLHDKYVLLQAENARLKRLLGNAYDAMYSWKEEALFAQAERDHYREQAQEREP
jgi:hypothetical protein